ncbi:MAG: DUF5615 family PIN-like protein [Opitutales bacterium]|nr:DUF5615 family PIN-like protein [Opitutales bacterium]
MRWTFPWGNKTPDQSIAERAWQEGRIVVSKDLDFLDSHLISGSPPRLLLISTGNISNKQLITLIEKHLPLIVSALEEENLIELNEKGVVVH